MKSLWFVTAATIALTATPALADLKSGDLAWQNGDSAMAVEQWRPLAIAGDPDAQLRLGQAYQLGRGVPLDLKLAEDWLRRAAQGGNAEARDSYGLILFQNGKRAEGLPYIEDAAGRGNPRAQYILAIALYNGDMIRKDLPRAYAMMLRASAAGIPAANNGLADMDRYIPLADRTRGKALAAAFEAHAIATGQTPVAGQSPATPDPVAAAGAPATVKPPKPAKVTAAKPAPKPAPAPTPKPASKPASAPVPSGKWRVQLGAFSDASKANALWTSLHSRIAALGPYQSYVVKAGAITRLQAGPLASHDAASQLCATVKAAKQPCMPVAP